MALLRTLLLLSLALLASGSIQIDGPLTKRITKFEILDDLVVDELTDNRQTTLHPHSGPGDALPPHWQPYSSEIRIRFSAFGDSVDAKLHVNKALFGDRTTADIHEGEVLRERRRPPHTVYRSEEGVDMARATLHSNGDFHGVFRVGDEMYVVDPLSKHWKDISEDMRNKIPATARMVVFRLQDDNTDGITCGVTGKPSKQLDWMMERVPDGERIGRKLKAVFPSCPSTMKGLVVSIAADHQFFTEVSGNVEGTIAEVMNTVNGVYEDQLNIHLSIDRIVSYSSSGGPSWNAASCPDINTKLDQFSAWRRDSSGASGGRDTVAGLWHLFTDCYPPPGTVGLAWLSVLCNKGFYGTGVSSVSSNFWRTVAHEFGHNFGACHDTSAGDCSGDPYSGTGIMAYGSSVPSFSSSSGVHLCGHINSVLSGSSNCLFDYSPVCGNGIKETGEDCDDSTSCCTSSCTFAPGATCTPEAGSPSCCVGCQEQTAQTDCTSISGAPGYCGVGGECIPGDCYFSNGEYCDVHTTKLCYLTCSLSGSSTCYDKDQVSGTDGRWMVQEGALCSSSARCNSAGQCIPFESYSWVTGSWSACSVSCNGGTRTRSVTCQSSSGSTVSASNCQGSRPASQEPCNTQPCTTYSWIFGGWSTCSATCGGGVQTRTVQCQATTGSSTSIVADSNCNSGTRPSSSRACNEEACATYSWFTGAWSSCSKLCGAGLETRTVYCELDAGGSTSAVADSNCASEGPKPAESQPCNEGTCSWSYGSWSTCDAPCGPGTQTRTVACEAPSGATVPNSDCPGDPDPSEQACNLGACVTYSWRSGTTGACDEPCGGGQAVIPVTCRRSTDDAVVDDSFCSSGSKPPTFENCNTEACVWVTGSFGPCTVTCGGGTQDRSVTCESSSGEAATQCSSSSRPASRQSCNNQVCVTYDWDVTYSGCSATCGRSGTRTATVVCMSSEGDIVDDSQCTTTKPATTGYACDPLPPYCAWSSGGWTTCSRLCNDGSGPGTRTRVITCSGASSSDCNSAARPSSIEFCNDVSCSEYTWYEGEFSACSKLCGGGTQSHTVECRDSSGTVVADSFCEETVPKPATQQSCNTANCVWDAAAWGACTVACGGGTQDRTVQCKPSIGSSTVLPDSECTTSKPATRTSCNTAACTTYSWVQVGDWTVCSEPCGEGTQMQTVECRASSGSTVEDSRCSEAGPRPSEVRTCNLGTCSWVAGGYGACSEPCNTGVQTRTVTCRNADTDVQVADTKCTGTRPATQQACNTQACISYDWVPAAVGGTWGACSENCGGGIQTRNYVCRGSDGSDYPDSFCAEGLKPATEQSCNSEPCIWITGSWSSCSATCNGGLQTRSVTCQSSTGQPGSLCSSSTKPPSQQTCAEEACPEVYWETLAWNTCTQECGGGVRDRVVRCFNSETGVVDDSECTDPKPDAVESCNTIACVWNEGAFSECSEPCNTGTQTRSVVCRSPIEPFTAVAEERCLQSRPSDIQECNTQACEVVEWVLTSDWTECSRPCGSGTRTRDFTCRSSYYGNLPDEDCDAGTKPATTETCNPTPCTAPAWFTGTFGTCEDACGLVQVTREVTCQSADGTAVLPDSDCPPPKPEETQTCIGETCISSCVCHEWSEFSPAECPSEVADCGEDVVRTRSRNCTDELNLQCCDDSSEAVRCTEQEFCPPVPSCVQVAEQAEPEGGFGYYLDEVRNFVAPNDTTGLVFPLISAAFLCCLGCFCALCVYGFIRFRGRKRHEKYDFDSMFVLEDDGTVKNNDGDLVLLPTTAMFEPKRYEVKYPFTSQLKDELNLQPGQSVMVTNKSEDGWFCGTNEQTGEIGYFPGNYVEESMDQGPRKKKRAPPPPPKKPANSTVRPPPLAPKPGQAKPPPLAPKPVPNDI